jgi:acetyl-CoA acetyltransferase
VPDLAAVITGIGNTAFSRRSGRSPRALAVEAARGAVTDAGRAEQDVDGIIPVGGAIFADDLIEDLALSRAALDALPAPGGNSGLGALLLAEVLIQSGRCHDVLIVFARNGSSAQRIARRVMALPGQHFRSYLERPQGWITPAQWYAMIARRHMIEFGTTKGAMAEVALVMRRHAQLNPLAQMYGRELTSAEYQAAPMISDPYQRWDCCLETDGAVALLVSESSSRPGQTRDVQVLAIESRRPASPEDLTNRADWFDIGLSCAAPAAYARAGLGPADVDTAMIYDCFTFEVLHQLEEAGFCRRGESDAFVRSGAIALGGALPVNTHGGLLAEGHLGGVSHILEAVRQLRGEANARQIPRARVAAVTGWGDWGDGSIALLARSGGRT